MSKIPQSESLRSSMAKYSHSMLI